MKKVLLIISLLLCPTLVLAQEAAEPQVTLLNGVQTVYPESVTVPGALREKLMKYRVQIPPLALPHREQNGTITLTFIPRNRSAVSFFTVITSTPSEIWSRIEYDVSLFPFQMPTNFRGEKPNIPEGIRNASVPCEPAELFLPEFLDKIARSAKVGWTAREKNGEVLVQFVRLKATPPPESVLGEWQELDAIPDNPALYPESVTVPDPLRKRLEGVRVNVNLVDRNGVGALISLLDVRVDHQFDPGLKIEMSKARPSFNLPLTVIKGLQYRDPEWLYPGLRLQKVTIKANGVALPTALDMLTQSLGVGWTAEMLGERVLVRIMRLRSTPSPVKTLRNSLDAIHAAAEQLPREPNPLLRTAPSAYLKEMVSLDVESASIRAALEALLRTTQRPFELAPETSMLRRSFRFETVSLSSALDLVCESYNAIWSLERDSKDSAFLSIRKRGEVPPKK
ncbi:hypothetical protein [Armatimonas sp.]|uniref:hypothetical protein n=1 Tax=Armatimonas sp. TaxID=1872638 RepID=UPI0037507EDF